MNSLIRLMAVSVMTIAMVITMRASADYAGPDGYGTMDSDDPTNYVVIEAEDGETEELDGETVIVVQEPEPLAATEEAPPPPQTVVVEQSISVCPGAIWVDGYWAYSGGEYVWVDGHCVVERVNYVFVHPRWDFYANVWWFVPGYYRPCGVYVGFGYYRPWAWYPPYYAPYYRGYRPVPVQRAYPRRPTTVRSGRPPRASSPGTGRRPGYAPGRTSTVERRPSTAPARTRSVARPSAGPSRTSSVARTNAAPSRTRSVARTNAAPSRTRTNTAARPAARAPSIVRVPGTEAATAQRARPGAARVGATGRGGATPSRSMVVERPPSSRAPAATVSRSGGGRTLTSAAPASRPGAGIVSQPRANPVRTARPANTGASRLGGAALGGSRGGGSVRGNGSGSLGGGRGFSRPSSGGGFGRSSSGGFGGGRSVPAARGR